MIPDLVVLDFEGTLAHRPGLWSQCLVEVLDVHRPGHGVSVDDVRPHLREGFPWHRPDVAHPELRDPEAWWRAIGDLMIRVCDAVGVSADDGLRRAVRDHYCDPTRFVLYADTLPALDLLASAGVRMTILSNHVPELDSIVAHHGLHAYVGEVITSARLGVEKPHPDAFRSALGDVRPGRAWMIGDNPVADQQGAAAVGMNSTLVRHPEADDVDLLGAVRTMLEHAATPGADRRRTPFGERLDDPRSTTKGPDGD